MPQPIASKLQPKPLKPLLALVAQWLEPAFGLDCSCLGPEPEHGPVLVVEPRKHMLLLGSQQSGLAPMLGNEPAGQPLVQ